MQETIGERIKKCRLKQGMSVIQLAERLKTNRATIYRYENGDIKNMPVNRIEELAEVLQTTPSYLMGWKGE